MALSSSYKTPPVTQFELQASRECLSSFLGAEKSSIQCKIARASRWRRYPDTWFRLLTKLGNKRIPVSSVARISSDFFTVKKTEAVSAKIV